MACAIPLLVLRGSLVAGALVWGGCVIEGGPGAETEAGTTGEAGTGSTSGGTEGMSSTSQAGTSGAGSTTGAGESETGCGFIGCSTGTTAPPEDCRPPEDPCPEGMKCTLDGELSESHCVDVPARAKGLGEACVTDGWLSGDDECGAGLICWGSGDSEGICVEFCYDYEALCECTDPTATIVWCQSCVFGFCVPGCDPLGQDCPDGDMCVPDGSGGFVCAIDASGEGGAYGDPCEYLNTCDPGLFCVSAENVPGCEGSGCCAPFCDLNAPVCPEGVVCVPFHEDAIPGYAHVGACVLP